MGKKIKRDVDGRRGANSPGVDVEITTETHSTLQAAAGRAGKAVEEVATEALAEGIRKLRHAEPRKPDEKKDAAAPKDPARNTAHATA